MERAGVVLAWLAAGTALAVLAGASLRLWCNLRFLRWLRQAGDAVVGPAPRVSILVPARDEARSIAACVTSLLAQEHAACEVLVLDDGSRDGTGALLDMLVASAPSLTVIHASEEPPAGWNGKSYACERLAARAGGDWLLFTDADTWHTPQSVARGLACAQALGVSLLSVMPRQRTETWSERLLVSCVMDFLPLLGLDLAALVRGRAGPVAANGQYLLVRADHYRAAGGHAAIRGALVDDIALARHLRARGYAVALVDGQAMVRCRMYTDAREVWDGFVKNVWLGLVTASECTGLRAWLGAGLFVWGYASVCVAPFVGLVAGPAPWLDAMIVVWLLLLRAATNHSLRRPLAEVVTTPVALWCVMALSLAALWRRWRHQALWWKGRAYPSAR